jgi:glycosyltransferase involved in cell wall biosynthesis
LKVLLPLHRLHAAGIGTVVRGLSEHVPHELREGEELLVIGQNTDLPTRLQNVRLLDPQSPTETPAGRFAYEQGRLRRAAAEADLVHLTDYRPLLLSRQPFILTIHDVFFLEYGAWYPPAVAAFKRVMFAAALRKRPRILICDSEYTRLRLLHHVPRLRRADVRVIYPGVWVPGNGAQTSPADDPYFLTVSIIEPRKNHLMLLEAFQAAQRAGFALRWKVVGAPGYRSRGIVDALRAASGVDVLGHVSDTALEELYRGALFHATPSVAEGFGFPPLEAMARGIPVIASSGSAMDETLGTAGRRVPPWDVRGWTEALLALESDAALRRELAEEGLTTVKRFSWPRAAAAYAETYRDAFVGGRR